jgi:hypothetical protein
MSLSKDHPREPVRWAGSCLFLLLCWVGCVAIGRAAETGWSDARLLAFLEHLRATDAGWVSALTVTQGQAALPIWDAVDRETTDRNLRHRLVLAPAHPLVPFVRGSEFVVRIDRARPATVRVRLEHIQRGPDGSGLERETPPRLRLWLRPADDIRWLTPGPEREFQFTLPGGRVDHSVELEVRTRDQRHVLRIVLLNQKIPVSWQNPRSP